MTAKLPTASNISFDEERGSVPNRYIAGEVITLGQAVYLNAGVAYKAIATSSAAAQAVGVAAGADNFSGETDIQIGGTVTVVVFGPVYGFGGLSLTGGESLWVDKTTAGDFNTAAPTSAYQFVVGHMIDNQTFFVDPGTASPVSA